MAHPGGSTNGENGITGFRPSSFEVSGISLDLFDWRVSIFLACLWIIKFLANSNFGVVLKGIRENGERVKALGYNSRMYKVLAFCISGFFSRRCWHLICFPRECSCSMVGSLANDGIRSPIN